MAKVHFPNENQTFEVPAGTSILELAAMFDTPLLFGCRSASCGTCLVKVLQGRENLSPISTPERDVLDTLSTEDDERLGCQAVILGDVSLAIPD